MGSSLSQYLLPDTTAKSDATATPRPAPTAPDLSSYLEGQSTIQEKQLTTGERFMNRFKNLAKIYKAGLGLANEQELAELGNAMMQAEQTPGGVAFGKAMDDIAKLGKGVMNMGTGDFKAGWETLKSLNPAEVVAGIPEAVQTMMTSPIESTIGIGLDKDTLYGMNPDERARAIKETAGNIVALAAGAGTGKAITTLQKGAAEATLAKAGTVAATKAAAREVAGGAFKRTVVRGLTEGAVAGTTQGTIAHAGEEGAFTRALVQGVLFAPIGVAFETVTGKVVGRSTDPIGRDVAEQAGKLAQTRQLQVTTQESLSGVLKKIDGIENADDIASAVVGGKLNATPDKPIVVPGVKDVAPIISTIARGETKANTYFYQRSDKMFDVLVTAEPLTSTAEKSFRSSGFVQGQAIEYKGKSYTFQSLSKDGKSVNLRMDNGKIVARPRDEVRVPVDLTVPGQLRFQGGFDVGPENVSMRIYDDFRSFVEGNNTRTGTRENLMDTVPTKPFSQYLKEYATARGYKVEEMAALEDVISRQMYDQHKIHIMEPDEITAYDKLSQEVFDTLDNENAPFERVKKAGVKLVTDAESNGMYIDDTYSGAIRLRDGSTNRLLGEFKNVREASEFINKSGQEPGVSLLNDSNGVPPRFGSGVMPVPDGPLRPNEVPYLVRQNNWYADLLDTAATTVDWLTPNRSIMTALDSKFGTEFFSRVFNTTQAARMKANALIQPYYSKLKRIEDIDKNMTMGDRQVIGNWMMARSAEELAKSGGPGGRALNKVEQAVGEQFADPKLDINRVMSFVREQAKLAKEFKADTPEFKAAETLARQAMGIDDAHYAAAELVKGVRGSKENALGPILRYAEAKRLGTPSRAEFATTNNMSPRQLRMGRELEALNAEMHQVFNLPKNYDLQEFMTHARAYDDGHFVRSIERDFKVPKEVAQQYARMASVGEIDSYEMDPIKYMQRFIKTGFDVDHVLPVITEARKAIKEEVAKLPETARTKATHMATRYLQDVQGYPGAAQKFTQAAVDDLTDKWGMKTSVDVRKNIVNTISATAEAAFQGFRIHAGIRDFAQGTGFYFARFGATRASRMLEFGTRGLDGLTKEQLQRAGEIPGLSAVYFSSPTEFAGSMLGGGTSIVGRGLRGTAEVGLKLSGQKDIYAMLHAGAYLETWKLAGEKVTALARGEITKKAAYRDLKIDTYEPAVVTEFDKLVTANKFEEASRFLARQTAAETIGIFGLGNNPGGWNRNIGRIAGQLGGWSQWFRSMVNQNLARGTMRDRLGFLARMGIVQAGIAGTGAALGVNFASWYAHRALLFGGGPLVDAADDVNTAIGGYGYEQQSAQRRLRKFLPYDPVSDNINIGQPYVPGSFFAQDLARAYQMAQDGANPLQVAGQAAGFRVQP